MRIHAHYERLTENERQWIDDVFAEIYATPQAEDGEELAFPGNRPSLANDDRIERAVDALARAVIESRKG